MNHQLLVISRSAPLAANLREHLAMVASVTAAPSLEAAACQASDELGGVVIHLCDEIARGMAPSEFLRRAQALARGVPLLGIVEPTCPKELRDAVAAEFDMLFPVPLDHTALRDQIARVADPLGKLAGMCSGPHKALHGRTRSMVTFTPSMFDMIDELRVAAAHDITVLLIGETGSGKTYLARLIHELSNRHENRFLTLGCGALPPDLIESELFGHVKGAFTGAERDKLGKFAAAGDGTLLLDEIDVLPTEQQAKLLRVIESGEYEPVGSNDTETSQARLIVASNFEVEELVASGNFRSDLYYRLNVLRFQLPPLRERPNDLEFLARKFAHLHSRKHGIALREVTDEFINALRAYRWPGNIRELENVIRRAVLYCQRGVLTPGDLPSGLRPAGVQFAATTNNGDELPTLEARIGDFERHLIEDSLRRNANRRQATAKELGISRVTLYNKMKKFGMLN
ncbi:MAG: sigma-54 dependent transcriptional regulator [Pirellulales bacterium]